MTYNEICKVLETISFDSKMAYALYASIETMSINGQVESEILRTKYLPDEIETFVLNSIVAEEHSDNEMTNEQFMDVMSAIRNYQPPKRYEKTGTDFLKWILPTIGAVQFESQQFLFFRLYRHHFLFTFCNNSVDIDTEFKKKFAKGFDEYAAKVFTLQVLLSQRWLRLYKEYLKNVSLEAFWFIDNLKMTRDQYRMELSQFAKSAEDYRYCLRPSYSYPFVEYKDKIYLPTPHLLIQSITSAMMNRLTYGNNGLRELIGKNACEEYLLKIVKDSGVFDEVKPEYEYSSGQKTLDILTRKGTVALLIDSKLFSPKVSLRSFDEIAYKEDVARIVKSLKQAYRHAHNKYNRDYKPFISNTNDVYALIVVYQEGYLENDEIYLQAAQDLSIKAGSADYTWLCHHIGITDLATFERFMLSQTDVLPEIMNRDGSLNQWFEGKNGSNLTSEVINYQNKLFNSLQKSLEPLFA